MMVSSSFPFRVVEHTVPCQHIREYPRATNGDQEAILHLAVKQYIPLDNPNPQPGDVTIIGGHANAFPKELYEPLWEDILARSQAQGFRIRSIWIADVAQQGHSGELNEKLLGNDPSWMDHVRDLLHLINVKREEMPRPIVGIGHSMGANNLANLALIHPRLFTTLVLIDPVIHEFASSPPGTGPSAPERSTFRRETWPSREEAVASFKKSKFYQSWDPRVLDRWIDHGIRDLPTLTHPTTSNSSTATGVTLTTTKHQELFTFLRPNYEANGVEGRPVNRDTHPDLNPNLGTVYPFYRPEPPNTLVRMPELRPSVLYLFGEFSEMSSAELREQKLRVTGTGVGGSGGQAQGRVKGIVVPRVGHLVAMEDVAGTATYVSEWLDSELKLDRAKEAEFQREWGAGSSLSMVQRQTIDEKWVNTIKEKSKMTARDVKL